MFPVFPIWIAIVLNRGAFKSLPKIYDGAFCENSKSSCLLFFSYFTKRKMLFISSKWHFSRYSFFCNFFPFVYHNLVQKNRLGSTWKNQVNFIKVFDNSLSKYLIFKSFWYELVVLGYFTKIKKWLDFTAHVLQAFSRKIFLTKYSINGPSSIIRRSFLPEISNNVFKFLFSKLML